MSLQAQPIPRIPEMTAKIARRAFRKGNVYMQMRDVLGTFFTDDQFADLYPADGQPTYTPWRLAFDTPAFSGYVRFVTTPSLRLALCANQSWYSASSALPS
jgi:hypothetical protein